MIKAFIFDFGRVISTPRPAACFQAYEDDLGLARGSINRIMFDSSHWQEALVGRLSMKAFWHRIGPSLGLATPEAVNAFRRRYYGDETVNQEVANLIRALHDTYRLAVLSNHPPGLDHWLENWGLRRYFDIVYCSGDEGCAKPDPAVYRATLARLGVKTSEAIFIDDTAGHVKTARTLGLGGIVFTGAQHLAQDLAPFLPAPDPGKHYPETDPPPNPTSPEAH